MLGFLAAGRFAGRVAFQVYRKPGFAGSRGNEKRGNGDVQERPVERGLRQNRTKL